MGWSDNVDALNELGSQPGFASLSHQQSTPFTPTPYAPKAPPPPVANFGGGRTFSFGGGGFSTGATSGAGQALAPLPSGSVSPLERPSLSLPTTQYQTPGQPDMNAPQRSTQGDIGGSIGAAFGDLGRPYIDKDGNQQQGLNIGNAIPFFMERVTAGAHELAQSGIPGVSQAAQFGESATGAFLSVVKGASDIIGPALSWLPNAWRDEHLDYRVTAYKRLAAGQPLDTGFFGSTDEALLSGLRQHMIDEGMGPEQARFALMNAMDLPESVKRALNADPNADGQKLLDAAPEGRHWSYQGGLTGVLANTLPDLLVYGLEGGAVSRIAGLASGALADAGVSATLPSGEVSLLGRTLRVGGQEITPATPFTVFAQLQRKYVAAGLGWTGGQVAMDAAAHFLGAQGAVDFFDNMNRVRPISNDPQVQLVTSFTVNPIQAAKDARNGTITLARGLGSVTVGKVLGTRYAVLHDSNTLINTVLAHAYHTTIDGVTAPETGIIARFYDGSTATAANTVISRALQTIIDGLPSEERVLFNARYPGAIDQVLADGSIVPGRTEAALREFLPQALSLLERDPKAVATLMETHDWSYHNYPGAYNPDVAGNNAIDFRAANDRNYELRQHLNAVTGYTEYVPPTGLERIQAAIGDRPSIPVEGMDGLQGLIQKFPALRKYWEGIVGAGDKVVGRAQLDGIIARAQDDYAQISRTNPIRATTGTDPILRSDSLTKVRDLAEALGVTNATSEALQASAPTPAQVDLLRSFLADKVQMAPDDIRALSPEDATLRAQAEMSGMTGDWYDHGTAVMNAEKEAKTLLRSLNGFELLRGATDPGLRAFEKEKTLQLAHLNDIIRRAGDPAMPFADRVQQAGVVRKLKDTDLAFRQAAEAKVQARVDLDTLQALEEQAVAISGQPDVLGQFMRKREGGWGFAGLYPKMSDGMFERLRLAIKHKSVRGYENLSEMGEADLWQRAKIEYAQGGEFYKSLTKPMRQSFEKVRNQVAVSQGIDDLVPDGMTDEEFIGQLSPLLDARNDILSGTNEFTLNLKANAKVPQKYVIDAEGQRTSLYSDPMDDLLADAHRYGIHDALDTGATDAIKAYGQDPVLDLRSLATKLNVSFDYLVGHPNDYADEIRNWVGAKPGAPGVITPASEIDAQILSNNAEQVSGLAADLAALRDQGVPIAEISPEQAQIIAEGSAPRLSTGLKRAVVDAGGDLSAAPAAGILGDPRNDLGRRVLNLILSGNMERDPATLAGVAETLRVIENGTPIKSMGLSPSLVAEAQRVGLALMHQGAKDAKQSGFAAGVLTGGLNPAMLSEDDLALARELLGEGGKTFDKASQKGRSLIMYDPADPGGSLQYGLKKAPSDAIVLELSKVPTLVEELLAGRFQPWHERVWEAKARQAYNYIFGSRSNTAIAGEAKLRFLDRARAQAVGADEASAIWDAWYEKSRESRHFQTVKGANGLESIPTDSRIYGTVKNIPTGDLQHSAQAALDEVYKGGEMPLGYRANLRNVDFGQLFRESSSTTLRTLVDHGGPIGDALGAMYGKVAHNRFVTTSYYLFRFASDLRMAAMNYSEGMFLYAGRAALKPKEITEGLFGQTRSWLTKMGEDGMDNTGFAQGRTRTEWAYKTFLKEQPDALRSGLKGLQAENPALMEQAIREIATHDPELSATIAFNNHTVDQYMTAMDGWYKRMVNTAVDGHDMAATFDELLAPHLAQDPAMEQIYGRLRQVNEDLWKNVRETFFGNPDRSRAERVLNSYLLFWPLSYQIKSAKWLSKLLFESAGGLKTNAAGAWLYNDAVAQHNQLMATDPKYADWFVKHKNLLFAAQMLFPITPDSIGVSLNPLMRDLLFNRQKQITDIGPVYTATKVLPGLARDLYPDLGSVPGFEQLYGAVTGFKPSKAMQAALAASKPPAPAP